MSNVQPLALTAADAKRLAHGAQSIWNAAIAEVTRGLDEAPDRPSSTAVRRELALAMYRIAMRELGEVAPDEEENVRVSGYGPIAVQRWNGAPPVAEGSVIHEARTGLAAPPPRPERCDCCAMGPCLCPCHAELR